MIYKQLVIFVFLSLSTLSIAQDASLLEVSTIPFKLRIKSNAVVRFSHQKIDISSVKNLNESNRRIITVLNQEGINDVKAYLNYDSNITIKKLEATIYDELGNKIKKIRKSDFVDVSAVSDFSLYEDSRVKYLKYTPISYPFTVDFISETSTSNTAYIPLWYPLEGYYISTEYSKYEVIYNSSLEIKTKEKNLEKYSISKIDYDGGLVFEAQNLLSIKPESYSPNFRDFSPSVKVALKEFYYEGYLGQTNDWDSLGKWMYDELLIDRTVLSEESKSKIKQLVEGIEDPIEKAKIVYNYVQNHTRYISVQEGIGGIQPEFASNVDALKYGDCKGLTNYTKALMDAAGVKSHYTRVNASRTPTDVDRDFVTFVGQTNHVILNIPNENNDIWLECTSQTNPFGYTAGFTDDRDVFVLTPDGGKIVHTTVYPTEDNLQSTKAIINLANDGSISGDVTIKTYGYQYGLHEGVQNQPLRDQKLHLKE